MNNEFMSPLIADYLNPDDLVDLHQPQSSSDPFAQSPMSPVPSTASTPPTSAPSTAAALATTASGYPGSVIPAPYHSMNPTTSAIAGTSSSASSFTGPVSLSTAPHYGGGGMPFPRRAEFSYAQNIHNHPYGYSPTTTMMGQPQLPRPRTLQMPVAPLLQTQQQQQQMLQQQQMMTPTSATTTTMVPEIPSSAPDGPPTGAGGARKRPKYTRSKKGCLTCRSKKIKCDERHPMCTRCEHGHRECTWPEAVLPRRPKGAMRGIGGEGDEEIGLVDEEGRRQSIPGSAVSTHFPPPSSTTSSHFPGISNNSPFEPAPRRDAFESDGFPAGSQFSVPALPANNRPFYPRQMGAAALPSGEFYPVTAVNGQPIEEYEFPPRQTFGTGASSSAAVAAAGRPTYPNGTLYPGAGAPSSSGYAADLRRASWDSSAAATDARRPSWDASGAHASSVSSPASSVVGLGLTGGSGGARSVGSSAGNTTAGSSISGSMGGSGVPPGGLMLLHSPDPLSPFFRSVQERNLVGNISSFAISSASSSAPLLKLYPSPLSSDSSLNPRLSLAASSSASTSSSDLSSSILLATQNLGTSSPVLSTASSAEFGVDASGMAYRRSSYPHLYADPQPLTIDPPVPVPLQGIDLSGPSVDLFGLASATTGPSTENVEWLAPPSVDIYKPLASPEEEEFISWSAYS